MVSLESVAQSLAHCASKRLGSQVGPLRISTQRSPLRLTARQTCPYGGPMQRSTATSIFHPQISPFSGTRPNRRAGLGWLACLPALLLLLLAPLAQAQYRASLRGTVEDTSGAVVPGATVTLINKDTNETKT